MEQVYLDGLHIVKRYANQLIARNPGRHRLQVIQYCLAWDRAYHQLTMGVPPDIALQKYFSDDLLKQLQEKVGKYETFSSS